MANLLIKNALVLRQPDDQTIEWLEAHDVIVRGQRIEAVQPTGNADASRFSTVIDAAGRVLMPGLINCHAHTPMVLFRGLAEDVPIERWFNEYIWPLENNLTARDVELGMTLGLAEMIEAGVTTVNEHYFFMDEVAQVVAGTGMRALLSWAIFSSSGEAMIERTGDFVRQWQGAAEGRIRAWMGPHAPYTCDDSYLRACAFKAKSLGVGIHTHAAETMEQTKFSVQKTGQTPIQVLEATGVLDVPTVLAHVCGALPEDIEIMARYQVGIAHCPKTYLRLAMGVAPVTAFREAGIPVGIGTDGVVSNSTLNGFEAMRLMAMLQKDKTGNAMAMPLAEALYTATRGGANVLGLGDELGAIEPGFLADMILVDLSGTKHQPLYNPAASLVYNVEPADVRTTIINGEVIMHEHELRTIDRDAVIDALRPEMARLSSRNPDQRIQTYTT